jgi:hypothetical protein
MAILRYARVSTNSGACGGVGGLSRSRKKFALCAIIISPSAWGKISLSERKQTNRETARAGFYRQYRLRRWTTGLAQ